MDIKITLENQDSEDIENIDTGDSGATPLKIKTPSNKESFDVEEDETEINPIYNRWMKEGTCYIPTGNVITVKIIPCGLYKCARDDRWGYYLIKESYFSDEILNLPLHQLKEIIKDISCFWDKKKLFEKYGYTHKRGILMYGKAGCGKSFAIQLIIQNLIHKQKGVVIKIENSTDLSHFNRFFNQKLRIIEPDRKVVVVIEDIDGLISSGSSTETLLLNLLDGINQSQNIVYLATTNYPDKLKERITNRPSRFDKRYDFSYPDEKVRKYYFNHKLKKEDIKKYGGIKKWVDKTEGLTISHLKELIVSVVILGNGFSKTIEELFNMGKILKASDEKVSNIAGFGFNKK